MPDCPPGRSPGHELVASFFTLTGSGFGQEPRHPFPVRCRAAAAAGFSGIGLHVDDLPRTIAAGIDIDRMREILTETGLKVVEIEFLGGWALDDNDAADLEATLGCIEAIADAFGGRHVSAGEFRGDRRVVPAVAAERLDALARRLAPRGLTIAVEAFPWSALAGPGTVPDVISRCGAPNVGQLVDVWHFYHNGGDPTTLAGPIGAVQLNDGPRVHDDFLTHARTARHLPGEGDLDVVGLIRAVLSVGYTGPWCVEVNTPKFRDLPIDLAAAKAARAADAVLDAAGAPRSVIAHRPPDRAAQS